MFEAIAEEFVQAAQPRSAYAAVHAVKCASLCGVDELVARLGHEPSLPMPGLRGDRAGPKVGSDLSEGSVRAFLDLQISATNFRVSSSSDDPAIALVARAPRPREATAGFVSVTFLVRNGPGPRLGLMCQT